MALITTSSTLHMQSSPLSLERNPQLAARTRGESLGEILKEKVLHPDHPLSLRCNELLRTVTDNSRIKVIVVDSKDINAAAYPGGLIVVTTGLVNELEYTEEMQALLKHEANHIEHNHALTSIDRLSGRKILSLVRYHEFESDTSEAINLSERGINAAGALSLHERLLRIKEEQAQRLPINCDFDHGDPELRADTIKELFRLKNLPHLRKELTSEDFRALIKIKFTFPPLEEKHSENMEDFWIAAVANPRLSETVSYLQHVFEKQYRDVPTVLIPNRLRTYHNKTIHQQLTLEMIADFLESDRMEQMCINTNKRSWEDFISKAISEIDFSILSEDQYPEVQRNLERIVQSVFDNNRSSAARFNTLLIFQYLKSTDLFVKFEAEILPPHHRLNLTHTPPQSIFNDLKKKISEGIALFGITIFNPLSLTELCLEEIGIDALQQLEFESIDLQTDEFIAKNKHRYKNEEDLNLIVSNVSSKFPIFYDPSSFLLLKKAVTAIGEGIRGAIHAAVSFNESNDLQSIVTLWVIASALPYEMASSLSDTPTHLEGEDRIAMLYVDASETVLQGCTEITKIKLIREDNFFKDILSLAAEESKRRPIEDVRRDLFVLRNALMAAHDFNHGNLNERISSFTESNGRVLEYPHLISLYKNGGASKVLSTFFFTYILGAETAKDVIDGLNMAGDHFTEFGLENSVAYPENEDSELSFLRYQFIKKCLDEYESLRECGWPLPVITQADLSAIHAAHAGRKIEVLNTLVDAPISKIPELAREAIAEWPLMWPTILRSIHESSWVQISNSLIEWEKEKKGTFSQSDYEGLASLLLFSQGSMVAPRAVGLLLVRSIETTENFEDGFRVLGRFSFLPLNILKEPVDALMQLHARRPDEIRKLQDFVFGGLSKTQIGDILIGAHLSYGASALGLREEDRLSLVQSLLTTNKSDAHLMELTAVQWWRAGLPQKARDLALRSVGIFAVLADRKAPPVVPITDSDVQIAVIEAKKGSEVLGIDSFVPFQDSYRQLFSGGPVFNYILLRQLLVSHSRGFGDRERNSLYDHYPSTMNELSSAIKHGEGSLLDSPENRLAIFSHLCNHYITGGTETEAAITSPTVRSIINALAYGPSSRTLFHNVGPLLAALTAQTPENPARFEDIPEGLWNLVLNKLREQITDFARPFRGQDFRYLQGVARARIIMMLTGSPPIVELDPVNNQILSSPSPERGYVACEDTIVDSVIKGFPQNRHASIKGSMSVIELATLIAEHNHAIGRRMLQLYALIKGNTFEENDRMVIEESFDRSPGMDVLRTFDVIDGNAKLDQKLAALVESIESVEPIKFGGSIFTVPETTITGGSKYAFHVCNTNAAWHCHEIRDFYNEIIVNLDPADISERDRQLALYLLDMATEWTLNEIEDPHFAENHEKFSEKTNTSQDELFKFYVPRIVHVSTSAVRPQEWFEGKTLTTLSVSDETDIHAGKISKDDAKIIAARIVQNFAQQLLEHGEDARIHSNIHPGNFSVKPSSQPEGPLTIGILDTKNMLILSKEERETLIRCAFLSSKGKQVEATKLIFDMILGPSSLDRGPLIPKLQNVVKEMKGEPFESTFSAILGTLVELGERPSLKWLLLGQNILGCMYILKRFGWEGSLIDSLFLAHQSDGTWKADYKNAATLYPNAWKVISENMSLIEKLGLKLRLN